MFRIVKLMNENNCDRVKHILQWLHGKHRHLRGTMKTTGGYMRQARVTLSAVSENNRIFSVRPANSVELYM